ncbi:toprim domain-containing protein [Paeniroseomonas aquatica]|uniref:Toprim domain-containing protein n=1 Tax=Paeniroseomonas aquatica TaxID=373043 RepID=A0ABT8A1V3_9PROT|nr:toprim domain-containing protein [Paeniroseomonas aquatica]MDN3563725.1 toprim domain-containing protein [Paeniroseomonas aquatica]
MREDAAAIARRLARDAEAVCRHYLSNGRREGRWWTVGDVANTPGRSLFVRLHGPEAGRGAAGKWTDAATGEHGDLLDLIARARGLDSLRDVMDEARRFLSLPAPQRPLPRAPVAAGSPDAAHRLFHAGQPIKGTLAETYLRARGITYLDDLPALRFHPRCYYRADENAPVETWPAMLAAVTDLDGTITGVHRTWLARDGSGKAPVATPRRAMGRLLGNGVRFGAAQDVVAVGEGIETILALRCVMPALPMIATLSASHLTALVLPHCVRRLYVARDSDHAGARAAATLTECAGRAGIEPVALSPRSDDFNDDLLQIGPAELAAWVRVQMAPADTALLPAGTG